MKKEFNNDWHNLPQYKDCECSFVMKLEAYESVKREVRYQYECSYKNCSKIEEVKDESRTE